MKKVIASILLFVCGAAASLLAVHISGPRYWEVGRVSDVAEHLLSNGKSTQALALLEYAGRRQTAQPNKDLLLGRACRIARDHVELSEALRLCADAAQGPKRMAQVENLMILAEIDREIGRPDDEMKTYQRIIDEYWDYRQSVAAARYLARMELETIFAQQPDKTRRDEIERLVEQAGGLEDDEALLRSVAATSVIWKLNESEDPAPVIEKYLGKIRTENCREAFILRLGVIAQTHPRGRSLEETLVRLGLPARDGEGDIIEFVTNYNESPPTRMQCAEAVATSGDIQSILRGFERIGASADGFRTQVADRMRNRGGRESVIKLLQGIVDKNRPEAHYADANMTYARVLGVLWNKEEAAKRMEYVIDHWPRYGSICVNAALEGSAIYASIGRPDDAKRILEKAYELAAADEKSVLESRAADLGVTLSDN